VVHNSPKKRQESIHKNLYPFNKLVFKGEIVRKFTPDLFIDMLAFGLVNAFQIFLHDEVIICFFPFFLYCCFLFFFLGALITDEPSTLV
jgi:hypothetical protein